MERAKKERQADEAGWKETEQDRGGEDGMKDKKGKEDDEDWRREIASADVVTEEFSRALDNDCRCIIIIAAIDAAVRQLQMPWLLTQLQL